MKRPRGRPRGAKKVVTEDDDDAVESDPIYDTDD